MKHITLINEQFDLYSYRVNKIYNELTSLNESYSNRDYNLILEGFWDKLMGKAKDSTLAATTWIGKQSRAAIDLYDKGVEKAKDIVQAGKKLVDNVMNITIKVMDSIANAPYKIFETLVDYYNNITENVKNIYEEAKTIAKEMGDEVNNVMQTAKEIMSSNHKIDRLTAYELAYREWVK